VPKEPSLVLGLERDTPLARAVELLDRHFSFLVPVGAVIAPGGRKLGVLPEPKSDLLPDETVIADGRLSTLRNPVRLKTWPEAITEPSWQVEMDCLHRLKLGPEGAINHVYRCKLGDRLWAPITHLTVSRLGPSLSLHIILLHPEWYPLSEDYPALRQYDMDHWMEMLSSLRRAVIDAGNEVSYVAVDLGHYILHEPWKTRLVAEARTIPMAVVE